MKYWPEQARRVLIRTFALGVLGSVLLLAQGSDLAQTSPAGTGVPSNSGASSTASSDAVFRRVSNRLLCQCGCNYMVLSCNHVDCSSASFIRRSIQTQLAAGKSEDAIVAGFVEQYGPRILPEPPKKGFNWSAWLMPFIVLVLGGALVSYILWRWKFHYQPAEAALAGATVGDMPIPNATAPELVEKYRAQIDRELEKD